MKNNIYAFAVALTAVFLFTSSLFAQETYNLSYKFSKGKTYLYKNETASNMTQEVMGREMKFDNTANDVVRFVVNDVASNGDAELVFSLDSAVVTTSMMGRDTTMDVSSQLGKRVKATITPIGEVKNFEELDSVAASNRFVSLSQVVNGFFARFAGKEIKTGDTWNNSVIDTIKNFGGAIIDTTDYVYTLAGKENKLGHNCLKIPFTSNLKLEGKGNMQGMDLYINGTGKASGTIYFDAENGMLIYSQTNMDNDMTMATSGAQSMVIPITQSVKATQSLIGQ